jgi:hypothetical protein
VRGVAHAPQTREYVAGAWVKRMYIPSSSGTRGIRGGSMSQPWQREEGVLRGRRLLPAKTYVYISICIKCMTCRAQWAV